MVRGTPIAVPVTHGSMAAACESSVRVPAVNVPVVAIRASVTSEVSKLVRYLLLLPVKVSAVPPESEAVNERAITNSKGMETDVVITPLTDTPKEIKSSTHRRVVLPHRNENNGEAAARVAAIVPVVTPAIYSPKTPGSGAKRTAILVAVVPVGVCDVVA